MCISRNQPNLAAAKVLEGKAVVLNNMCRNAIALLHGDGRTIFFLVHRPGLERRRREEQLLGFIKSKNTCQELFEDMPASQFQTSPFG